MGMPTRSEPAPALVGRQPERETLDSLVQDLRSGRGRALVVRGEAGVGKSALLEYAAGAAADMRLVRAAGVESEMELAFAGVHQLCAPLLDRLERLPAPQRDAVGVAFGLRGGGAPDRFLVGLAVLTLLSEAAEDRPLLGLVDDAQWLDRASAQVLGFAARRLLADPVGLLFAARDPGEQLGGLPDLEVRGLRDADARGLLRSVVRVRLDEQVRDRIVAETAGNPLALLELPRGLSPVQLAGGFGLMGAQTVPGRVEESFRNRLGALPADTRLLLLVAAAEPAGDAVLVWRAAGRLEIAASAAAAEADGLVEIGTRVRFRHPLVRSAVYRSAGLPERRAAHLALAEVTDRQLDPDRRAWHLAAAAAGPDEQVAAELERSAGRAQARGGLAAAAAFLERSVLLTADPARHAERLLAAAQASMQAGAFAKALELLTTAAAGPLDEFQHARTDLLRGQIAFASRRGSDAPPLLLKAAKSLELLDAQLARETYLEGLFAALFAGRLALGGGAREVAEAARAAASPQQPARAPDLLLDGLALVVTEGYPAGAPVLKRAVSAFRSADVSREEGRHWLWLSLADLSAGLLWDYESWDLLSARRVKLARDASALTALPFAATVRAGVHLWAGEFVAAATLVAEVESVTEATGSAIAPTGAVALAAFTGREADAADLIAAGTKDAERRGEGRRLTFFHWATAVLGNSLGRYADALAAAQQASEDSPADLFANWALAEVIEAATRSGAPERAAGPLERLSATARASGTDWAIGVEARSRALVTQGDNAETLYREAIGRLGRTRVRTELARAHLLYGEWLRRARRRIDAREQLRLAHQMFDSMGMAAFAERAGRELRATGERARPRGPGAAAVLTPQEEQIARLVAEHLTNREIAAQLFLSASTVEYHLRKIFRKLDVGSRAQLARMLRNGKGIAARRD